MDREQGEKIIDQLKEINDHLRRLDDKIGIVIGNTVPSDNFSRILGIISNIAGILGIVFVVEKIISWLV